MHNNGYLSLGGLLIDSSHIPKLLKTSDIVYIFQAKYYMIFYNTENENNTKIQELGQNIHDKKIKEKSNTRLIRSKKLKKYWLDERHSVPERPPQIRQSVYIATNYVQSNYCRLQSFLAGEEKQDNARLELLQKGNFNVYNSFRILNRT